MEKFSENQIRIETIVRQLGSNGMLLGHWLLVNATVEYLDGHPPRTAVHRAAELHGIPVHLAYSRLRGVLSRMEKVRSERYMELRGGERLSPVELIEKIAADVQQ